MGGRALSDNRSLTTEYATEEHATAIPVAKPEAPVAVRPSGGAALTPHHHHARLGAPLGRTIIKLTQHLFYESF